MAKVYKFAFPQCSQEQGYALNSLTTKETEEFRE